MKLNKKQIEGMEGDVCFNDALIKLISAQSGF